MFGYPKCPSCGTATNQIDAQPMRIGNLVSGPIFLAVVATCPQCKTILGVLNDTAGERQELSRELKEIRKAIGLPNR